jgi:hypothetical protein
MGYRRWRKASKSERGCDENLQYRRNPFKRAAIIFRNLTELPPLFYFICLAVIFMGRTDVNFIVLACSYVALRVEHSFIHLTSNKVPPRFCRTYIVLLIIWVRRAPVL